MSLCAFEDYRAHLQWMKKIASLRWGCTKHLCTSCSRLHIKVHGSICDQVWGRVHVDTHVLSQQVSSLTNGKDSK
ncbi:hypothetical protein XELAEV_18028753mg [Xenopus laevis]|uniref:Uncharacterized protein n=1 Tax=Xenopus laevis TaxID=8355 RepID=A0A974CS08_XENLA|nr:hypothetical protein XELAEV_18028753mg [Xenopus laevis]